MKKSKKILIIPLLLGVSFCIFKPTNNHNHLPQEKTKNNIKQSTKPTNSQVKSNFTVDKENDTLIIKNKNMTMKCKAESKKEEDGKIILTNVKDIIIKY